MIPSAPTGITLAALLNAWEYLGNPRPKTRLTSPARRAAELVDSNFKVFGEIGPLLLNYSTMPAALATFSDDARSKFLRELSRANPQSHILKKATAMISMEERATTRCSMCIDEDIRVHGFAFARSLHQIPTVKMCPVHRCLLEYTCGRCRLDLEFDWSPHYRKTHNVCRNCGAYAEVAIPCFGSEGHQAYVELLYRGMLDKAPEVRPDQLNVGLERFSELAIEHGIDLRPRLMGFWRAASWLEVCGCIGASSDELYNALVFGVAPNTILGTYGLASFFHSCIRVDLTLPKGRPSQLPKWWISSFNKSEEDFRQRAHEAGLPMKVVLKALSGEWTDIRLAGAMKQVRALVATLEQRERERLWRRRLLHVRKTREKRRIQVR